MYESFDLEIFRENTIRLFDGFQGQHSIHHTLYNEIFHTYNLACDEDNYTLYYDTASYDGCIAFRYTIGTVTAIQGWIDVDRPSYSLTFDRDDSNCPLYTEFMRNHEKEDVWRAITSTIIDLFKEHFEYFRQQITKNTPTRNVVVDSGDLIIAMEDMFLKYSTHEDIENAHHLASMHGTVSLLLFPNYTLNGILLRVTYAEARYTKDVYELEYNLSAGICVVENGTKPHGFDEGFAKFKLLGALMY